jgi:hypothetical protein
MSILNINKNQRLSQKNLSKCLICEEQYYYSEFNLPCKCEICKDCFVEWFISENQKNYLKFELEKKCPNHLCLKEIYIEDLFKFFSKEELNKINDILFEKYLTNKSDIRKCPYNECKYAAWFNLILNQNCEENYICEKCNFSWKDASNDKSSFKEFLNQPINFIAKDLSDINVKLFSKPCPKCTIQIYKFQGCDSVKCPRCDLQFCYNCFKIHENSYDYDFCSRKKSLIIFFFFFFILISLAKIYLTVNLFYMICNYYVFFIFINLIYFIYVVLLYCFCVSIYAFITGKYMKRQFLIMVILFSSFVIFLHIYYLFYSDLIQFYTKFFLLELFLIFTISILIYIGWFFKSKWNKRFLKTQ